MHRAPSLLQRFPWTRLLVAMAVMLFTLQILAWACPVQAEGPAKRPTQFILMNLSGPWHIDKPESFTRDIIDEVRRMVPARAGGPIRLGVSFSFSYFARDDRVLLASLERFLQLAEETDTPIYIWLDGEIWWQARPDLWNWWDPKRPGFDPRNRENVEWSSWSSDDALKISWLNWGRQIRMLPPPNLMSARYRAACHERMRLIVPVILQWWEGLPAEKKDLFAGLKVGWESSIGVNMFYYPNGNALLDKPPAEDPRYGIKADQPPARGVAQIGYAAVKTAGLRSQGQITEADLAEVARRHLEDLSRVAAELGMPRQRLFTHGAGWKEKELLYSAAVNPWSCPGWSFYRHAGNPAGDAGVQEALAKSDAPYWAATEWLFQGPRTVEAWRSALEKTLADPRCRLVCVVNWSEVRDNAAAIEAFRQVLAGSTPRR